MKIDGGVPNDLPAVAEAVRAQEEAGYDGLFSAETSHDPFLPLVLAAEHTERPELGTSISVAFPRSPMHLANLGHDLQAFSKGRFILGLGSQIKTHIEKRFSSTWSQPAARMRELILAMRAIWNTWNEGEKLEFRGEFYSHTLMTPFFNPGPTGFGPPKVYLAGVGERMTEAAGEVADGFIAHGFTTPTYLRDVSLPALERGLAKAGRSRKDFAISCPVFVVTGATDQEMERADQGVRQQVAFYGSTPQYRGVLEKHGWGDLQTELNTLSKRGQWVEMGKLIDDDMVSEFAVVAEPEQIAGRLKDRYGGVIDRISFYAPYRSDPDRWKAVLADIKAA